MGKGGPYTEGFKLNKFECVWGRSPCTVGFNLNIFGHVWGEGPVQWGPCWTSLNISGEGPCTVRSGEGGGGVSTGDLSAVRFREQGEEWETPVWWIPMQSNNAIHKAAGSLVTGCSQKSRQQEQPPGTVTPLMTSGKEQWNSGIVPYKSWNGRELWGWRLCE